MAPPVCGSPIEDSRPDSQDFLGKVLCGGSVLVYMLKDRVNCQTNLLHSHQNGTYAITGNNVAEKYWMKILPCFKLINKKVSRDII